MSQVGFLGLFAVIGLGTFLLRASFLAFTGRSARLTNLERFLKFVPVTVLPALIVPALVFREGVLDFSLYNPRLVAGLAAIVVARKTGNVVATLAVGMGTLWLLQWGIGG